MSFIKENVELLIQSVNEANSTLTDAQVFVIVPKGVLTERSERVSMIMDLVSDSGEVVPTYTFEEQDFVIPTDGDVVAVHLDCGREPKIVAYKGGVKEFDQGVILRRCCAESGCFKR